MMILCMVFAGVILYCLFIWVFTRS